MQKVQLKLQKPIVVLTLIVASLSLIYALGFATDMYALSYHADSTSKTYVAGAELYHTIQPFNKALLYDALILFLLSLTNFLTLSHKRRLYYPANYVTGVAFAGFAAFIGVMIIQYVTVFKAMYLQIDFEKMKSLTEILNLRYVESTFVLDCGYVLGALLFVTAIAVIANLVVKTIWMREEKKLLAAAKAR